MKVQLKGPNWQSRGKEEKPLLLLSYVSLMSSRQPSFLCVCLLYYIQGFSFVRGRIKEQGCFIIVRTRSPLITVLMHLFANSNICVNFDGSVSLIMALVFINCLVNFDWLPDITNFTLLGARHLCFLVNLLQLFLGMLFSYLECIWSSWILLLKDLLSGTGVGLSLWLIVLYCRSKTPMYSMVLYQCLINYEVSDLMSGKRKFPALGKLGGSFWVVLPQPQAFSSYACTDLNTLLNVWGGLCSPLGVSLCTTFLSGNVSCEL